MRLTTREFAELIGGGINDGNVRMAVKRGRLLIGQDGRLDAMSQAERWRATVRQKSTRGPGRPPKQSLASMEPK